MYGVELMLGAEINILDTAGNMDMSESLMRRLDIRIASIHSALYSGGDKKQNTEAVMLVIRNPLIDIIAHPADGAAELDFESLVLAAKENHTLLEINNSSLNPVRNKVKATENSLELLRLCKKYHSPIILGSDAHISFDIAAVIIYKFGKHTGEVVSQVNSYGGMRQKYSVLLHYILEGHRDSKIVTETRTYIKAGVSNIGGTTMFHIQQCPNNIVMIDYEISNNPIVRNFTLRFKFSDMMDQNEMIEQIELGIDRKVMGGW